MIATKPPVGIPTTYRGIRFRSRLEARWAAFFDELRWTWTYEPFDCAGWIPDFALQSRLQSGKLSPRPVLVEVKPISDLDPAVTEKIDAADQEHQVLVVGIAPFKPWPDWSDEYCIGWLRDGGWAGAALGRWGGSLSGAKNPSGVIGFCHAAGVYYDRITGCFDGGHYGDDELPSSEVEALWARATNAVQWRAA